MDHAAMVTMLLAGAGLGLLITARSLKPTRPPLTVAL
jgi:hypothetical protein